MQKDDHPITGPAAAGAPAEKSQQSEAGTKEQSEGEAETETEGNEAGEGEEAETGEGEKDESEDAEGDADGEQDEDGEGEKPKRKPRHERYQRQIERLRHENAELRSRSNAGSLSEREIAAKVEEIAGAPPKESEFNGDYLAYERALTVYELDKKHATREVKAQVQRSASEHAERMRELAEAHDERIDGFRKTAPDFDKVMRAAASLKASPAVETLILESESSAHLVYYFAKNPSRLDDVNRMGERDAAREIGRIESRLSLPNQKKQTQAPKPVKPLKGAAAPSSPEKDLDAYIQRTYGPRKTA